MKTRLYFLCILVFLNTHILFFCAVNAEENNYEYPKEKPLITDEPKDKFKSRRHTKRHKKFKDENDKFARRGHRLKKFMESLSDEEKKELHELRKSDHDAFRKKMKQIIRRIHKSKRNNDKGIRKLVKKYHSAGNDKQREKIKSKIRKITIDQFKEKMSDNQKELERIEQRVKELRTKYEVRKAKMDEIIDRRIENLLRDPELEWRPNQ